MAKKPPVFGNLSSDRSGTSAEDVAARLREMIESGELSAGDKLPPERDLAKALGVSRPTLRAGIRSLSAVGILYSKQGAGTFVAARDDLPALDSSPLKMLSVLHGFTSDEMFEARLALEMSIARLAAKRVSSDQMAMLEKELAGMHASVNEPEQFLVHDMRFHQIVWAASGNRILTALTHMVAAVLSEDQGESVRSATDLKELAERRQNIYRALRDCGPEAAAQAIHDHLIEDQRTPES